jgi:hypothetical protein
MTDSRWTELGGTIYMDPDNSVYQKEVLHHRIVEGVRLTAIVRKQPGWVEVDLNAPGLHPGENGF